LLNKVRINTLSFAAILLIRFFNTFTETYHFQSFQNKD